MPKVIPCIPHKHRLQAHRVEYLKAADKINNDWRNRSKYHFYKEKDFWNGLPPKKIRKIIPDDDYDIIRNEEE